MASLISVVRDREVVTTSDQQAAIAALDLRLQADGQWVFAGGLSVPDCARVLVHREPELVVAGGPLLEAGEHLGDFGVRDLPDADAACSVAGEASGACRAEVELRPCFPPPAADG